MAKKYRPVVRDQGFLLPPDMRDWLPADHGVWLVIAAVGRMDTSAFHAGRRTGGAGAAGYDPDMLVTLLVWAYAQGIVSSRRMESLCGQDVAFRVICGGSLPDHATIARFRAGFADGVVQLFTQVLILCARLGMGRLGTVALDGTKIRANASKSANRSEEWLAGTAAERAAAHAETDAAEDVLFGDACGDEVPAEAASPFTRDARIDAALASARAERERRAAKREQQEEEQAARAAEHVAAARAGTPKTGKPPAGTEVELAEQRLAREHAAAQARYEQWQQDRASTPAGGGRRRGRPPAPPGQHAGVARARQQLEAARQRAARAEARDRAEAVIVRNITDPDSRLMKTRDGFVQGYNGQQVVTADLLVIATELTDDPTDTGWYEPMMEQAQAAAALIRARQPPAADPGTAGPETAGSGGTGSEAAPGPGPEPVIALVLADAGYLSKDNLTCPGPDRLIATGKRRDLEKAARAAAPGDAGPGDAGPGDNGEDGSKAIAEMTARLATEEGITSYRQRGHIAETPHGDLKHNMNFSQLSVRGKHRTSAEWRFAWTVHNLRMAITSGHLTRHALTQLSSQATRQAPGTATTSTA